MQDTPATANPAKLFVGNLAYSVNESQLTELFAQYGTVVEAVVLTEKQPDYYSNRPPRSRGMGFVTMSTPEEAQAAIAALHDQDFSGRKMIVATAKPKTDRPERSGQSRRW
jgi:RNA recognition motif-containing protein